MKEIWKIIKGFEDYQVNIFGNVKSEKNTKTRILKLNTRSGYAMVTLRVNNKSHTKSIHRLMALAFIKNPENKPCINHIDGNKLNNNVNNLEWCTYSENIRHAIKNNMWNAPWNNKYGKDNSSSKPVLQYTKEGVFIREFDSMIEASRLTNTHNGELSKVCNNKVNSAGGFKWKFKKI